MNRFNLLRNRRAARAMQSRVVAIPFALLCVFGENAVLLRAGHGPIGVDYPCFPLIPALARYGMKYAGYKSNGTRRPLDGRLRRSIMGGRA